jgi:hypothetical protein
MALTQTEIGVEWTVVEIAYFKNGRRRGDGDTFDALREQIAWLGDRKYLVADLEMVAFRLPWVDTPETRKEPAKAAKAAAEFTYWIEQSLELGPLTIFCYGTAGWDRILADIVNADGNSAAQYMMTEGNDGRGWPLYEEK